MYRIGVGLGGTNIAAGLVDSDYNIVLKKSIPTDTKNGADRIASDIAKLCNMLCEEKGITTADIDAIGIASPGIAERSSGCVKYSCNLPFVNYPICEAVSKATGVADVIVENDANAAAWGEAVAGAAKGTKNSIMITLGTGVGGGIIIDNKIYSGFNSAGAEIGHVVIEYNGRPCSCGRRGCWEAYSSATAIIKMTKEKIEECEKSGRSTVMTDIVQKKGKVSGATAFDAMRCGDEAGREVVDTYLGYLACGLANMVNIFQPEVISIGGGISNEGQSLVDSLMPLIDKERYGGDIVKPTEIRIAELKNDAGIIGAALLSI